MARDKNKCVWRIRLETMIDEQTIPEENKPCENCSGYPKGYCPNRTTLDEVYDLYKLKGYYNKIE